MLKPGGTFLFLEHVASPKGTQKRWFQDYILTPISIVTSDGCHQNREIGEAIQRAGFSKVEMERFEGVKTPYIVGKAVK